MRKHEFTAIAIEHNPEGKSFKPVGRFFTTKDALQLVRTCMRLLVQLESDPVSLEACMSELRVLERKLDG